MSPSPSLSLRLAATATASLLVVVALSVSQSAVHAGAAPAAPGSTAPTPRAETSLEAVAPTVTTIAVPPVAATSRTVDSVGAAAESLRAGAAGGVLVAHVRRPVVESFSLLGVTWQASGGEDVTVSVRSRHDDAWSDWTPLHVDEDEGPSAAEDSQARAGTEPLWVGDATGVEVSVYSGSGSAPPDLQVSAIDPGASAYDTQTTAPARTGPAATSPTASGAAAGAEPAPTGGFPVMPNVVTRRQWGADESLGDPCWAPRYGTTFKMVFVHHTAGSNDYSRAESASIVRGIYAYHTQARGWCDIGYNFLVDRYGTVYEGRAGGMRRPVRGAHSGDYNVNTTGISLMGTFETASPTRAMKRALVSLIAWRMGTAYHGAYGRPAVEGKRFARISGHRDAMSTACPGQRVYDWLPRLRERVAARLGTYESGIERRWHDAGGPGGPFGEVRIGERRLYGGRATTFAGGRIFAGDHGVFAFRRGRILAKFTSAHGLAGLGFPTREAWTVGDRQGVAAVFEGGRIYFSKRTDAQVVTRGPVLRKYRRLGFAEGRLGFPTSGVFATKTGDKARFENGTISWDEGTGKTTVTYG